MHNMANVCGTCNWSVYDPSPEQVLYSCPNCGAPSYYVPVLHGPHGESIDRSTFQAMKFVCPKCNIPLPEGATECPKCGTKPVTVLPDGSGFFVAQIEGANMRHPDFERIKREFETYYCKGQTPCPKGDFEYYTWLQALQLDESKPYGQAHESFSWARENIHFVREDEDNKYYQVLVGFPVKSMNGNVYKERDLIAAAMSMKGVHPSLNHKDEFWFSPKNPANRWGVLTVTGGKYEDGAVEAMLQVPKSAICPICGGRPMTELIDTHRIVNVSLEGDCVGGYCGTTGECTGFKFNEKGFSLLTSDVLPGIPMARIFPMESYLPFSQSPKTHGAKKRRVIVVGLENMSAKPKKEGEISGTPDPASTTPPGGQPDAKGQCPAGQHFDADLGKCVADEAKPPTQDHIPEGTTVATGNPAADDTSKTAHTELLQKLKALTAKGLSEQTANLIVKMAEPGDFDACVAAVMADGKDEESARAICAAQCNQSLQPAGAMSAQLMDSKHALELSQAIERATNAESDLAEATVIHAAEVKAVMATLASTTTKLNEERNERLKLEGRVQEMLNNQEKQGARLAEWNTERRDFEDKLAKRGRDLQEALDERTKTSKLLEDLRAEHEGVTKKYREALSTNLALNRRLTETNENTLALTKKVEDLEERLKKAKRLGKHISVNV